MSPCTLRQLAIGLAGAPAVVVAVVFAVVAMMGLAAAPAARAQSGRNPADGVTTVEVFANSAMLITGTQVDRYQLTIHRMDQLEQVKQTINQMIPRGGEGPARAWIAAHEAQIKRQVRPAAIQAANAISLANYYKLDRLPAVVINRQAVVYGLTDLNAALQRYQAAQGARP